MAVCASSSPASFASFAAPSAIRISTLKASRDTFELDILQNHNHTGTVDVTVTKPRHLENSGVMLEKCSSNPRRDTRETNNSYLDIASGQLCCTTFSDFASEPFVVLFQWMWIKNFRAGKWEPGDACDAGGVNPTLQYFAPDMRRGHA